jgi:RimJ/RimL family protein N-acetyltransferase
VTAYDHLTSERLELRAVAPGDLEQLFTIMNDPAQWHHAPHARHLVPETTVEWIERAAQRWESEGLSYWVASTKDAPDTIIGAGGAQRQRTGAWNLYWRVAVTHRRQGFASEIGRTAMHTARELDQTVPMIAWINATNAASIAVATRLGLQPQGPQLDPSDGTERLAFSDRRLEPGFYAQL